ncbi:rhomboid family intramembrane serine protease [Mesohalobacter halotolerans]|uniref:Rhomboid family intramembrane serine protease n=1 Tax=Mesohalobacter halotolerans TaxID=1883405 RepID=A0A4V6ALE2_9FLAO|nr:rhomboid family intramembrane serine protease [Mesohalobacter halotolerans]MBS3739478.1 rhomboid family intramembrane serine protease [Psychroflexus sp.]TKS56365.1 rhomboid family intramembrane serine protease [Mesohalobacter halotolerans]
MTTKEQIIYKYKTANVLEKLIALNVIMFVLTYVFRALFFLMDIQTNFFIDWMVFPKDLLDFILKPWSIITYAFLHSGFLHILFNMIILYFGGQQFLTFYSGKKLLNYYVLGAIFGALIYMLSYNLFPAFAGIGKSYLIGASAAVMAVFIGIATKVPNMSVRLFLLGNIKLWWIAAFFVLMDIIQMPFDNPGGHLAHLGGAFIGYFYTKQLDKGNDIGKWIEHLIAGFQQLFSQKPKRSKSKMKTVYKNKSYKKTSKKEKDEKQKRVDDILDKISQSGYDSLTKEEKDFLFNAGKDI